MFGHVGIVQDTVQDLQFGDGLAAVDVLAKPGLSLDNLIRNGVGDPAVALGRQRLM
jgi:hypothetical protein